MTLNHRPAFSIPAFPSPPVLYLLCERSDPRFALSETASRPPLCFHTLTNSFFRSSFLLTSIQIAGGCHPVVAQIVEPKLELNPANSSPINLSSVPDRRSSLGRGSELQLRHYRVPIKSWALAPEASGPEGLVASPGQLSDLKVRPPIPDSDQTRSPGRRRFRCRSASSAWRVRAVLAARAESGCGLYLQPA